MAGAEIPDRSGSRSVYPDAMIAARRLAENNIAVEKAKLAQNIYGVKGNPINALKSMPDVPEGWTDISNDNNALSKIDIDLICFTTGQKTRTFCAGLFTG